MNKKTLYFVVAFRKAVPVFLAYILACSVCLAGTKAKYVFLMIGDGMGTAQRTAAEFYLNAEKNNGTDPATWQKLTMNSFPVQGMTNTFSANSLITDSAAAGTALACGQKTNNGVISMNAECEAPFGTIAEKAKKVGMKIGIVTSVSIDHATPACFYAHEPSRKNYPQIAMTLANSSFDYFGGGQTAIGEQGQKSVLETAVRNGFRIVRTRNELQALTPGEKVWAFNHTCEKNGALYYEIDRPEDHLALKEFTAKGVELLENPDGFFMMVEGGKIDWACHANDAATVIGETLAFDEAVAVAYEFYRKHPNDTLIVVTADHECGGMTIGFAGTGYKAFPERLAKQKMSAGRFDKTVEKWRQNPPGFTDALNTISQIFGFTDDELAPHEKEQLQQAYSQSMLPPAERTKDKATYLLYGSYEPLTVTCTKLLNQHAGIGWTSYSHTGIPVQTSAIGVGSSAFSGCYDNTELCQKLVEAMGIEEKATAQ